MGSHGCTQEHCPCSCHHHECHHDEHHHHHGEDMKSNYFLELANNAWEEVLKEKIKERILETQNDRMAKLAKIIAEGNNQRWKNKIETKQGYKDFMEEICKFFNQSKK